MIAKQPKWVGRALALGLLLALILAAYQLAVAPLVTAYQESDKQIAEVQDQLTRFSRIAQLRPAYEEQMQELGQRLAAGGIYLKGETDSLAGAELQARISGLIEQSGGRVRSIQILPVGEDEGFRKVGARVQLTATLGALEKVLYALEASKPFVFIENLDIKNRRARRRNKDSDAQSEPELTIRFDAFGYLRPELTS
ncbi:MAG: type II secretion system protein GspM [Pseudomonadota bacterium]